MVGAVQSEGGDPPYRVGQVARMLGVSSKLVLDALKSGRLSGFKLNRMWLIPRDGIDRLSAARLEERDGPAKPANGDGQPTIAPGEKHDRPPGGRKRSARPRRSSTGAHRAQR
jgi:excisionase family DNA binding protein